MKILNLKTFENFLMDEETDATDVNAGATGGDEKKETTNNDAPADQEKVTDDKAGAKSEETPKTSGDDQGTDWRKSIAGEDEALYKRLQRYSSQADIGKKISELEKLASKVPMTLSDNPTEEEVAAYRKQAGIPEKPEDYQKQLTLPEGLVIGDDDKPMMNDFFERMHNENMSPDAVNAAVNWYFDLKDKEHANFAQLEKTQAGECTQVLREDWGPDYAANKGMIQGWLQRQPDGIGEALQHARGPDGKALFNNDKFVKWMAAHIRETEPSATIIQDSEMSGVSIEEQIREIQAVIKDDPDKYGKDKAMQEKMLKLSNAKRKMQERA